MGLVQPFKSQRWFFFEFFFIPFSSLTNTNTKQTGPCQKAIACQTSLTPNDDNNQNQFSCGTGKPEIQGKNEGRVVMVLVMVVLVVMVVVMVLVVVVMKVPLLFLTPLPPSLFSPRALSYLLGGFYWLFI